MATVRTFCRLLPQLSRRSLMGGNQLGIIGDSNSIKSIIVPSFAQIRPVSQRTYAYHEIPTKDAAKGFVFQLDDLGRELLSQELKKFEAKKADKDNGGGPLHIPSMFDPPSYQTTHESNLNQGSIEVSSSQIWAAFMFNGLPFIGFGILDNMIMIVAGEYIDMKIGALLGISTMAAAALGNLISDVAGVGMAGYIEILAAKLVGIHPPDITAEQSKHWKMRWAVALARAVGISVGCFIGMFPLLFFKDRDEEKEEKSS